jgi:hypothetical protein
VMLHGSECGGCARAGQAKLGGEFRDPLDRSYRPQDYAVELSTK